MKFYCAVKDNVSVSLVGTLDKRGGELFLGNLSKFLAEFKQ